ncbi:hypothetical protein P154DRAFT_421527 [Amniculicola lignicola CBS 123094]|uniref:Endoplasmic reticulum junction formation protein lunapark n=1 Tax=Amniculicola lignicola CBS 123094 TaxID=1392246 RepID=A0A6A5WZS1_9PLEO|nr:hypothetical protein P154DRAFT_421527 [Amniculicola lignicola CBS 123094]
MVFWPFKSGEDAASFEKTLSNLAVKITKTSTKNDTLRLRSRRVRVMWTLYAGFAYILAALLLVFVTGWQNWGPVEGSVMAGGPVLIFLIRTATTKYYDYRIASTQAYLENLNKERDSTIERLKAATKYNSTQQLLEKYGSSPKTKESPSHTRRKSHGHQKQQQQQQQQQQGPRTNIAPPPTANVPRIGNEHPQTPQRAASKPTTPQGPPPDLIEIQPDSAGEEFAPNAFSRPELTRQYSTAPSAAQTHWYDRILDALLGEDETQAKNRLALICGECRLVNGQAPPGTVTLEDVGKWRCGGCGAWNGEEKVQVDAIAGLVQGWEADRKAKEKELSASTDGGVDSDNRETEDDTGYVAGADDGSGIDLGAESLEEPPAKSTRSKSKAKGKR